MKRKIVKKKVKLSFPNAKDFLRALLISSIIYFTLFAIGYIFNNTIVPLMIITTLTTIFIYGMHDTDIRKRTILIRIIVSFSSPIILFIIGGFVYGNFRDGFKILLSSKDNFVSYSLIFGALYYVLLIQLFQKNKLIDWYDGFEVGGRWENSLLLNDMSHSTQAIKKNIYLEAMHEKQYVDYKVTWKAYHRKKSKRKGTVKLHTAGSWTDMNNYATMEEFLETYGCYWPYHILVLTSPEIDSYKHDGVWYSKETASEYEEEMMAHLFDKEYDYKTALKKQKQIWNKKAAEVWAKIPDSYWITVVDLHN